MNPSSAACRVMLELLYPVEPNIHSPRRSLLLSRLDHHKVLPIIIVSIPVQITVAQTIMFGIVVAILLDCNAS